MARMNSQDRSLKIAARANGWDPDEIIGDTYFVKENRATDYDGIDLPRAVSERGHSFDERSIPVPTPQMDTRTKKTQNADPYEDKPGAR